MFLEKSKNRIIREFEEFCRFLPGPAEEIQRELSSLDEDTALALKYLYANMPCSDVGNYSLETFLDYALQGIYLWDHSPYRKEIPEDIFLNDVLFHRVNEEEIKPCRRLFGEKIQSRIEGMDMKHAILEVNYWCAQEMTYQTTDDRTSSALDCYKKGYGRCGEESVFAVNALRSVGIPARQVYAPKWSHCDDNHAWVEVWCDGEWHYFGACEPEAVLDKGWFTNAASRAMMVHSRSFAAESEEEKVPGSAVESTAGSAGEKNAEQRLAYIGSCSRKVVGRDGINIMENQLSRYAKTKTISIRVEDLDGCPAEGARILAEVLNYSEFSPIARLVTGADGSVLLETGLGSLHIFAELDGEYGECLIDTREEDCCVCVLGDEKAEDVWVDFDMIAPADTASGKNMASKEQEEENNRRTTECAEIRRKKTERFRPVWKDEFLREKGCCNMNKECDTATSEQDGCSEDVALSAKYMAVLSDKDRTDADPEVLREHYEESLKYQGQYPEDIFLAYLWNPRVADEVLTKWRCAIRNYFHDEQKEEFRKDPKSIWNWIRQNIMSRPERERLTVYTVPAAVLRLGIAENNSCKVLFVAICRTLGIPARLNPEDGAMEYLEGNGFVRVLEESEKDVHLTLRAEDDHIWTYFLDWSLARLEKDGYHSLKLKDLSWTDGCLELDVEPGEYRLLTSNRLPTGNIFAKRYDFAVKKGDRKEIVLEMREADLADMLDHHTIPDYDLTGQDGRTYSVGDLTDNDGKKCVTGKQTDGDGKEDSAERGKSDNRRILFWLEVSKEPTEHILNELMEMQEDYRRFQKQLIFIVKKPEDLSDPTLSRCREALPEVPIFFDTFGKDQEMTARRMYVDPGKLPLLVVTDDRATGLFAASGYSVGMADMLLRVLKS